MKKLNFSVPHSLPEAQALKCILTLFAKAKAEHGDSIRKLTESWNGNVGTFSFKVGPCDVRGSTTVGPAKVQVTGELEAFFEEDVIARKVEALLRQFITAALADAGADTKAQKQVVSAEQKPEAAVAPVVETASTPPEPLPHVNGVKVIPEKSAASHVPPLPVPPPLPRTPPAQTPLANGTRAVVTPAVAEANSRDATQPPPLPIRIIAVSPKKDMEDFVAHLLSEVSRVLDRRLGR